MPLQCLGMARRKHHAVPGFDEERRSAPPSRPAPMVLMLRGGPPAGCAALVRPQTSPLRMSISDSSPSAKASRTGLPQRAASPLSEAEGTAVAWIIAVARRKVVCQQRRKSTAAGLGYHLPPVLCRALHGAPACLRNQSVLGNKRAHHAVRTRARVDSQRVWSTKRRIRWKKEKQRDYHQQNNHNTARCRGECRHIGRRLG